MSTREHARNFQEILESAHRDLHDMAQIVDDLRSAPAAAATSLPGSRNCDKARRILRDATDSAGWKLREIDSRPRDAPAGPPIGASE